MEHNHEQLKSIVADILSHIGVEPKQISIETEPVAIIAVQAEDSSLLIGSRGETLRAINHLFRAISENRFGEDQEQFIVDVNGYQARRLSEITQKAHMMADRARMFKYDVELSPMNAYERRIVHATLSDIADITTESQGEGKFRRVVVKFTPQEDTAETSEV